MAHQAHEQWLLYDGDCPFCSAYVKLVRLRDSIGPLPLIDAREGGPEVAQARAAGLDLDEGMVLKMNGRLHHGDDCVHRLALLSTASGPFNRFNAWVFRAPGRARVLYPMLRAGRGAALALLGRRRIGDAAPGADMPPS